jgi:hypothetical protein
VEKKWITGREIAEKYGIAVVEIGRACHEGRLHAYMADICKEIYELSALPRVPKYPPPGTDARAHVGKDENVFWDWDAISGVDALRQSLSRLEIILGACFAVWRVRAEEENAGLPLLSGDRHDTQPPSGLSNIPAYVEEAGESFPETDGIRFSRSSHRRPDFFRDWTFEKLSALKAALEDRRFSLQQEIIGKTEPNFSALVAAQRLAEQAGISRDELYSYSRNFAWKHIMSMSYDFLVGDEIIESSKLEGRVFFFDFDMFRRQNRDISVQDAIDEYKNSLGMMLFDGAEIEACFGSLEEKTGEQPAPKKKYKRYRVSAKEAARMCGVSESLIRKWEKTGKFPEKYPGRNDEIEHFNFHFI